APLQTVSSERHLGGRFPALSLRGGKSCLGQVCLGQVIDMALTAITAKRRLGEKHSPLRDQVVTELRQAILSGRLKPGERLVEGRLADGLGVSRNPVREAIRALASEGLIEVTARRGA